MGTQVRLRLYLSIRLLFYSTVLVSSTPILSSEKITITQTDLESYRISSTGSNAPILQPKSDEKDNVTNLDVIGGHSSSNEIATMTRRNKTRPKRTLFCLVRCLLHRIGTHIHDHYARPYYEEHRAIVPFSSLFSDPALEAGYSTGHDPEYDMAHDPPFDPAYDAAYDPAFDPALGIASGTAINIAHDRALGLPPDPELIMEHNRQRDRAHALAHDEALAIANDPLLGIPGTQTREAAHAIAHGRAPPIPLFDPRLPPIDPFYQDPAL
ncbi:hypothetical protein HHI36_015246 [Cryptolaemus montrouzieri]|uniref:Uncharacterized protein n=1 Tax=Cryptolaemus montrouzieri TaxID=559131 RepID=A0ABD2N5B7_9CUCU